MQYSDTLLAHFRHPAGIGVFPPDLPGVHSARVGDPRHGAVIGLQIRLDEQGRIIDARFRAYGCGATIAAASWVRDWLPGRTVDEACALHDDTVRAALDLPPAKLHCAVLAVAAVRAALDESTEHATSVTGE